MAVNHFKEFGTVAEYEAYIQPDDYAKPLVALVDETDTVMFPQGGGGGGTGNPILTSVDVDDYSGGAAFNAVSQMTGVEFPSGITPIDKEAFYKCTALTSVDIPSGVTSIGTYAFFGCTSLTSIDMSNTAVTTIGNYAFSSCNGLTSVILPSTLTSIGTYAFSTCRDIASVTIPDSVTTIGQNAFADSRGLTSVTLSSALTSIGASAFLRCTSLTSVTVRATTPPTLGNNVFGSTHADMVIYVPAESVETYKAASGWSNYASKIQAIP